MGPHTNTQPGSAAVGHSRAERLREALVTALALTWKYRLRPYGIPTAIRTYQTGQDTKKGFLQLLGGAGQPSTSRGF